VTMRRVLLRAKRGWISGAEARSVDPVTEMVAWKVSDTVEDALGADYDSWFRDYGSWGGDGYGSGAVVVMVMVVMAVDVVMVGDHGGGFGLGGCRGCGGGRGGLWLAGGWNGDGGVEGRE
jgi:hypothetical protein